MDESNDSQVLVPKLRFPLEPGLGELLGGLGKEECAQQQADEKYPQQKSQHVCALSTFRQLSGTLESGTWVLIRNRVLSRAKCTG